MDLAYKIIIPILLAVVGYLVKRTVDSIDQSIKETKESQRAMSNRMNQIESHVGIVMHDFSRQTSLMVTIDAEQKKIAKDTSASLARIEKVTDDMLTDVSLVKDNYGKVILVLKQLVNQKTKKNP